MRKWLVRLFYSISKRLARTINPVPQQLAEAKAENVALKRLVSEYVDNSTEAQAKRDQWERVSEMIEARTMAGSGPWRVSDELLAETDKLITYASERIQQGGVRLRETSPLLSAGATGDIELALQNVEWRREINLSWLEFSRWGIQQLILISRLQYIKHPWIQRGINVAANYVFGRGVEVKAEDDTADEILKQFFERNKKVLGQAALADLHKRLQYDGQIFYCFFADAVDTGEVNIRTIDATEIFEIITNPDDTDEHWYYHRKWTSRKFDPKGGVNAQGESMDCYYPALNAKFPDGGPVKEINGKQVMVDNPVLMQKGGTGVGKWLFDTPKPYAALDWARNGRKMLEADLTTRIALSRIAMTLTTKGGQQALEGAKQQLGTTVGPNTAIWDQNPPAVPGATFASGPGTSLAAFDTRGAIRNPKDVAEYRNMVAIVFEEPPTWFGDMETSNMSTAQTLDRPTELGMMEKQERWREVLIDISTYVLTVDQGAARGKLSEAKKGNWRITEALRMQKKSGQWVYVSESQQKSEGTIQLKCIFPSIREGDMPANVKAITEAMTLDNKGGQIVGIDERAGVARLAEELGLENYGDVLEEQYPDSGPDKYDPNRTKEPLPAPIGRALPPPGGVPQLPGGRQPSAVSPQDKPVTATATE